MPTEITLNLGHTDYRVLVGDGLLSSLGEAIEPHAEFGKRAVIVTDANVGALYAERVVSALEASGRAVDVLTVPAGETSKSMDQVTDLCRQMLQLGHDRKSFLIALGGGVVGDLAGFVAAVFQRGIPFVQIPTSVVAQVDSSVGGKTGVNVPEGKNLVGAFHQPRLVLADTETPCTLPERDYNEGFAEVIKHAAIRDESLFDLIESQGLSRDGLEPLIARNVGIKARVVEEDERETSGTRALLNFGHTIGHAIEAAGGYGRFLHGEAISLGLVAAARLSVEKSALAQAEANRIISNLETFQLPITLPADLETSALLTAMQRDKKFESGQIRFVLLRSLGDAFVSSDVMTTDIEQAIERLRA